MAAPLREIARISPSRYHALEQCPLREIWSAARTAAALPAHPAAYVGSVIHSLLEEAGRGLLDGYTAEGIGNRWGELIRSKEQELARSWLERSILPLSTALLDVEVRKRRACLRASEIVEQRHSRPGTDRETAPAQYEQWVQTPDGKIGGLIDCAYRRAGRLVLRDYKSGSIHGVDNDRVKEEYAYQLKLYAALYAFTFQEWPDELELVPLQGSAMPVPFERAECEELCVRAATTLDATNGRIVAVSGLPAEEAAPTFARPSAESCRFCQYRPMCRAYRVERTAPSSEPWPVDAWGLVREVRLLGNGSGLLVLETTGAPVVLVRLRGIEPDVHRHPALQSLEGGGYGAAFNMRRTGYPNNYVPQGSTVLYAGSRPDLGS